MKIHACLLLVSALAVSAVEAAPRLDDYAQGMHLQTYTGRPVAEVLLPDQVYQAVTRQDLGDVRVFNKDGTAVPHAFCAAPTRIEPVIARDSLPVFELQGSSERNSRPDTQVEVQTSSGTEVRVREGIDSATAANAQPWAHVIDVRGIEHDLRSIDFDWSSPDGASQAQVRIEASADLDRWHTVVDQSTLLRVSQGEQQLQRKSIPLAPARYQYLRVVRVDGGPPLHIAEVIGEHVSTAAEIEPIWFSANSLPNAKSGELSFDAARLAPIAYARLVLPLENTSVQVRIESRPDEKSEWRQRWSGEVYSIVNEGRRRISPPAELSQVFDRYWRVVYVKPAAALDPAPALELGYRPAKLRFLVQGASPFTLAFGSRRAEVAPAQACGSLLADIDTGDLGELIGEAVTTDVRSLGGETALRPPPTKTPVRLVVLWVVLIAGAVALITMALSLLKRLNRQQS
jgi:hypothetical protein